MPVSSSQPAALSDGLEIFFKSYHFLQPSKGKSSDFAKHPDASEKLAIFFQNYQGLQVVKNTGDFLTDKLSEFFTNYQ